MIFIILGIPLLIEQNSSLILLPVVGIMIETIVTMVIYSQDIDKKYRKTNN